MSRLLDNFTTNEAAPIASPRTCEPGPGQLTVTDTGNRISIASNKLHWTGGDGGNYNNARVLTTSTYTKAAGLAWIFQINYATNQAARVAFNASQDRSGAGGDEVFTQGTGDLAPYANAFSVWGSSVFGPLSAATDYKIVICHFAVGYAIMLSGGAAQTYPTTTLLWLDNKSTSTPLYAGLGVVLTSSAIDVDDFQVADLSTYPAAGINVASPSSGSGYTATAAAIHDLDVTTPNPLAGSAELRYRVQDSSNYWAAYCDSAGAFKVDSVSAGTPTNRVSVASVWAVSSTRTIRAICEGTKHNFYTLNGSTWSKRGAQVDVSHMDTQTSINATFSGGPTVANLMSWNRVQTIEVAADVVVSGQPAAIRGQLTPFSAGYRDRPGKWN